MRSNLIFVIFFILFPLSSWASFDMGVAYSITTKNTLDESSAVNNTYGLQGSYNWGDINVGLESNFFQESEVQASRVKIDKKYLDVLSWVRYNFVKSYYADLFFGLGTGAYWERIKVSVLQSSLEEDSKPHWLAAAGLGVKLRLFKKVRPSIEYRVLRRVSAEVQNHGLRLALTYQYD